ncbi:hypothetical protein D3C79_644510 [compost metagenome]
MMCYSCKEGKVTRSGCHEYCDKCNYTAFVVTTEYVSSCAYMLGTLVSNTKFDDVDGFADTVKLLIVDHLPLMDTYLNAMVDTKARNKFFHALLEEVKIHAVNLQGPMFVTLQPGEWLVPGKLKLGKVEAEQISITQHICPRCGAEDNVILVDEILSRCGTCQLAYRNLEGGGIMPI